MDHKLPPGEYVITTSLDLTADQAIEGIVPEGMVSVLLNSEQDKNGVSYYFLIERKEP